MHKVHLKYGDTKMVRKGNYLTPIPCRNPHAKLMTLNLKEVTCENCNKMIDAWGREMCFWSTPGIIKITKAHWPKNPLCPDCIKKWQRGQTFKLCPHCI